MTEDEKTLSERVKAKAARVRAHVERHKTVYACAATGVICVIGTRYIYRRGVEDLAVQIMERMPTPTVPSVINNTVAPAINMAPVIENTIENAGRLHKVIKRIKPDGTEEFFETVWEGARTLAPEYGIQATSLQDRISKCINGHLSDYRGDRFVSVGIGTR